MSRWRAGNTGAGRAPGGWGPEASEPGFGPQPGLPVDCWRGPSSQTPSAKLQLPALECAALAQCQGFSVRIDRGGGGDASVWVK